MLRKGRTKSFKFDHTIYFGREMRDRAEQGGFVDVGLYGSLDGYEYGLDAPRLIAIARKP